MNTISKKQKGLVGKSLAPLGWLLAIGLALWSLVGVVVTFVLLFSFGLVPLVGVVGAFLVGALGVLLFLVLPWKALNLLFKGAEKLDGWMKRDEKAEALILASKARAAAVDQKYFKHSVAR